MEVPYSSPSVLSFAKKDKEFGSLNEGLSKLAPIELLNSMHDAMVIFDLKGRIFFSNSWTEKVLKCSRRELIDIHLKDSAILRNLSSKEKKRAKERLDEVIENEHLLQQVINGEVPYYQIEIKHVRKEGVIQWFDFTASLIHDSEGSPLYGLGIVKDITEQKEIENDFYKLSKAIIHSPVSVVITDTNGTIEYVNPKFSELTGYTFDEAIGSNPQILKSGCTPQKTYTDLWKTIQSGEIWHGELVNKKKNGDLYWEEAWISPITGDDGEITHFVAIKEDITERVIAEQTLQESEARWRSLVQNSPAMIFTVNRDEKIEFVNYAEIDDYSTEEIIGKSAYYFVPEEYHGTMKTAIERVFKFGETQKFELKFDGPDGAEWWFENSVAPIRYKDEIRLALIISVNITESKQVEKELRMLTEELENRVIDRTAELQQSEAVLMATLEATADGIIVIENEGMITLTNSRFCEMWTIPEDIALSVDMHTFLEISADQLHNPNEFLERTLQISKSSNVVFDTLYFRDGRVFERYTSPMIVGGELSGRIWSFRDISEQKSAESALKSSETKYRGIFDESPIAIGLISFDGKLVEFNKAYSDVFGITSIKDLDAYNIMDNPHFPESVVSKMKLGETVEFEGKFDFDVIREKGRASTTKTGEIYLNSVITPLDMEGLGRPTHYLTQIQDVTERTIAENEVRIAEKEWRVTFNSMSDAVSVQDKDLRFVKVNRAMSERFGISQEEMIGKYCYELVHGATEPISSCPHSKMLKTKESVTEELFVPRLDEHFLVTASPIFDEKGNIVRLVHVMKDITVLKQSEARYKDLFIYNPMSLWEEDFTEVGIWLDKLRASGVKDLSEYLKNNPEVVSEVRSLVKIIDFNRASWQVVEADSKEHLLENIDVLFSNNAFEPFRDQLLAIWDGHSEPLEWEASSQTLKGNPFHHITTWKAPEIDGKMDLSKVIVGTTDITKRREAEKNLEDALARAEFFMDLMGHDLTNIHQAVIGILDYILYDITLPPKQRGLLEELALQVARGTQLITSVKKFTRIENEGIVFSSQDLAEVLTAAMQMVETGLPGKKLQVKSNLTPGKFFVLGDAYLLDVFFHLLQNAMKFDAEELVRVEVNAQMTPDESFLRVQVMDHGPGIPDKSKELLFERIERKKEGYLGSGIGLTLTKQIIDHYEGKIWVEDRVKNERDQGAKIVMLLPSQNAESNDSRTTYHQQTQTT